MKHFCSVVRRIGLGLALLAAAMPGASAHDPFDGNIQLAVYDGKLEAKVTLGYDASREVLRAAAVPATDLARIKQARPDSEPPRLPAALAARLVTVTADGKALQPVAVYAAAGPEETNFLVIYPRPAAGEVSLQAVYLGEIAYMRPGMLVVVDRQHRMIASKLLSPAAPAATVPMARVVASPGTDASSITGMGAGTAFGPPAAAGMDSAAPGPTVAAAGPAASAAPTAAQDGASAATGFGEWFKFGVGHILEGYDHLLFLCALLISVRGVRQMLLIITAFTVAHSITLALSALNLVSISPKIVEPVIAASIAVACLANLLRKDNPRASYGMAGGFGLIHGFGFAGALRETGLGQGGDSIVTPLLSFNLGVEAGQLLVAAVVIPILILLRRHAGVARYSMPALSTAMVVASFYWLYELTAG